MVIENPSSPRPRASSPSPDGELVGRRVLVVDDDRNVAEVVARYLERDGAVVDVVGDGGEALARAVAWRPDLVVLDLLLPGLDGWQVCRRLRLDRPVPVIMLSALADAADRLSGFDVGADDYLGKPFSARELVARARAVLRRTGVAADPAERTLRTGDLVVDRAARTVCRGGKTVVLTAREFDFLVFLLRHPGVAFTREELLEQVWGWRHGDRGTVTVYVRRLREKLEDDPAQPRLIRTVWRVGYRLEDPAG